MRSRSPARRSSATGSANARCSWSIAFVVQAVIFGAGHAPYPTQPSFARPVELIIPSIGFGLLYVYYGLLPGIVLHFAFDVVWFALPIFLSDAPGIWFQKVMVVVMTLVPLWVVLWRRRQSGAWTVLAPSDRNAAWTPPAAAEPEEAAPAIVHQGLSSADEDRVARARRGQPRRMCLGRHRTRSSGHVLGQPR